MLLGAHVSTAGGMRNALTAARELSCEAIAVFTRNQRQWLPKALDTDDARTFRAGAPVTVSHASYLINLCATDPVTLKRSRIALVDEIDRCAQLGIRYLCLHPGSHLGAGEEVGLKLIAESLKLGLKETRGKRVIVLLENTAGQGTNLGYDLEHLSWLRRRVSSRRVGFCLDTCHLFAAGYDPGDIDGFVSVLGLEHIHAFHLNDSKHPRGSRRDRHEHIGEGEIGSAPFRKLVRDKRLAGVPGLLETPGGFDGYAQNLARLRKMQEQ